MQASPPNFPVYSTGFLTRKSAETVPQQNLPAPPPPSQKLNGKGFSPPPPPPYQEIKRKSLHSTQCNNNKDSK